MKKHYKLIIILSFLLTQPSFTILAWDNTSCNESKGGSIVTIDGINFCKSTEAMNWWSGYTWCQAMGGHMPTIQEFCPNKAITDGAACGHNYGTPHKMSQTPQSRDKMWGVIGSTIYTGTASTRVYKNIVFCLKD